MPGGDGTGPMGMGPMTGGGRGYCAVPAGRNLGRGFGFGRGRGRGRGFGRGFGFRSAGYPYAYDNPYMAPLHPADITPTQEADMLKTEANAMQEEINAINQRITELESGTNKAK